MPRKTAKFIPRKLDSSSMNWTTLELGDFLLCDSEETVEIISPMRSPMLSDWDSPMSVLSDNWTFPNFVLAKRPWCDESDTNYKENWDL